MTNRSAPGQIPGVVVRVASSAIALAPGLAMRDVYSAYAAYVWNTLRRLGAPVSDLEDLTHDVFVQVQRHLDDYDPTRPIKPWLFGFALRIISQHRRRGRRHKEGPGETGNAVDPAPLADERLAIEDDQRLVLAALGAIEPERRAVFVLYELDGVTIDEIARTLSIPVNTTYSRLRVARAEFRAAVTRLRRGGR
jgi:RNA polymerase sigma-70 factor (ECF subfamily)